MTEIPAITLNDGKTIPQLGFGVWQVPDAEAVTAVTSALRAGYRSIDTAQGYENETGVGKAITESGIARKELFITSKLRTREQGYDATLKAFMGTLDRLGLEYLDMFLIHWPAPAHDKYAASWKAFVQLQRDGRIGSIGVSNFLPEHLDRIIGETSVVPAVNQIEVHPQFQQREVRDYHRQHNIAIESYSPLGSGALLKDAEIAKIAQKHGVTPAQVMIRWQIQEGLIVIPKSVQDDRIRQNRDVLGFELDAQDLADIAAMDRPDGKTGGDPATNNTLF